MFFLIRGIGKSYPFELATEMPGYGGKFDDLVFKYRQSIDLENGTKQEWYRYRFLQAKHKQEEVRDKITATQLLSDNKDDFSLPKYLRSYFRDIIEKNMLDWFKEKESIWYSSVTGKQMLQEGGQKMESLRLRSLSFLR